MCRQSKLKFAYENLHSQCPHCVQTPSETKNNNTPELRGAEDKWPSVDETDYISIHVARLFSIKASVFVSKCFGAGYNKNIALKSPQRRFKCRIVHGP